MQNLKREIAALMERLRFPANAQTCFLGLEDRMLKIVDFGDTFEKAVNTYMVDPNANDIGAGLGVMNQLAEKYGENSYTMQFVFLMHCALLLLPIYSEKGISEEIYWDSMDDLRSKLLECMEVKNVPGTFVAGWFSGWFKLERFALGRLQYEYGGIFLDPDLTLPCGYTVKYNTKFVAIHIPSHSAPMTDEVRNESYRKAYEFYKDLYHGEPVVLRTCTWILYTPHLEFLPERSHLRGFINDFYMDTLHKQEKFGDAWRLVGAYADLPVEEWPEETSMQRGYKKWLLEGQQTGLGAGIILLDDGKNVTKIPGYYPKKG